MRLITIVTSLTETHNWLTQGTGPASVNDCTLKMGDVVMIVKNERDLHALGVVSSPAFGELETQVEWRYPVSKFICPNGHLTKKSFMLDTFPAACGKCAAPPAAILNTHQEVLSGYFDHPLPTSTTVFHEYPSWFAEERSRLYRLGETFTVTEDGHVVGHDGFIVPRNVHELYEREPKGVAKWVHHNIRTSSDDERQDWESEMWVSLCNLRENGIHRKPGYNGKENGCRDVVETFNPVKQFGASACRFHSYLNRIMTNRLISMQITSKRRPLEYKNTRSIGHTSEPTCAVLTPDWVDHNSPMLLQRQESMVRGQDARLFLDQFRTWLRSRRPHLVEMVDKIVENGSPTVKNGRKSMIELRAMMKIFMEGDTKRMSHAVGK